MQKKPTITFSPSSFKTFFAQTFVGIVIIFFCLANCIFITHMSSTRANSFWGKQEKKKHICDDKIRYTLYSRMCLYQAMETRVYGYGVTVSSPSQANPDTQ